MGIALNWTRGTEIELFNGVLEATASRFLPGVRILRFCLLTLGRGAPLDLQTQWELTQLLWTLSFQKGANVEGDEEKVRHP